MKTSLLECLIRNANTLCQTISKSNCLITKCKFKRTLKNKMSQEPNVLLCCYWKRGQLKHVLGGLSSASRSHWDISERVLSFSAVRKVSDLRTSVNKHVPEFSFVLLCWHTVAKSNLGKKGFTLSYTARSQSIIKEAQGMSSKELKSENVEG